MWEVKTVLNSSEELMVDEIDKTDRADVAKEVQYAYDASKRVPTQIKPLSSARSPDNQPK